MREDAVWIPTSDGVRLDASVCLPDGATPPGGWPGVLLVHGHGEDGRKAATLERARKYAARGRIAPHASSPMTNGCDTTPPF